ncbi:MAG: hypothetical protein M3R49_00100 [Chloroflexota bacterium]|nr:hypothetical protein [Chloroflexota bacterium]
MNVRRYLRVAIVLAMAAALAIAGVVYLGLFAPELSAPTPSSGSAERTLTNPGDTVTMAAIDRSGRYGTITLTRRGERPIRADERQQAVHTGGATTVVELHIAYVPARASDSGIGNIDWQVWVGGELDVAGDPLLFPPLVSGPDSLGDEIPGRAAVLSGIIGVAIPPSAAGRAVYLVYAPFIVPIADNQFDWKVVARIRVWGP